MNNKYKYKISIIIVNYNVEYFLDQCLDSVTKGIQNLSAEVFVVDNCSVDGSVEMVKSKYPDFRLIENKDNIGFSKANNQAIEIAQGEYILLLNPDTVVQEDTFLKTVQFMDKHADSGGLGVRMVDGKGVFLPESKRGLPTPIVAFYKIFGLSALFPKSKKFGQYHLGHLSEFENHEIDILSGAYMLMRKTTLEKVGFLDESFFMYGEDIDLSYRITLGGYKNYYCSDTKIIHYKGESTKKSSVNYVFVFYRAMIIFAQKHLSGKNAKLFSLLINFAIYLRAFLAISLRILKKLFLPAIDITYLIIGLFALTNYWKMSDIEFPKELISYSIPIYAIVWLSTSYFNGGYDYPVKLFKLIKGVFIGTLLILIAYAILPKSWQFSRLFIFIGAGWTISYYFISRVFLHFAIGKQFKLWVKTKKSFAIIDDNKDEFNRIKELIRNTNDNVAKITQISSIDSCTIKNGDFQEIIFSSKTSTYSEIIDYMSNNSFDQTDYKIAPKNENFLIGSNSIDTSGDLYILNLNALISKENKRKKRLFDLAFSLAILISSPILIWTFNRKKKLIKNISKILVGNLSFIGFSEDVSKQDVRLPKIKPGILFPSDIMDTENIQIKEKLNLLYARDYSMRKDFSILIKAWKKLDL
ncbi:MAG: glycosyltransferase family 2 protein [Crocinitomicaceae bacterium]|nr:glycosyltransferase family 2 protein [Crocinitomicaceae bacterium]